LRDGLPVCFYCGREFEEDVHVEWRGAGRNPTWATIDLHVDCARDLAIHLASDHLKAAQRKHNGT
jgi:hypothetical protein